MTADTKTINVYSERVSDYQELSSSAAENCNLQKFIDKLPVGANVFDIGAGPGHDAAQMAKAGLSVVALEPTPEFADLIEKQGIKVQRRTFSEIDEIEYFDAAWASFSLLHAKRVELPAHLKRIADSLKKGGRFVLGMKTGHGEFRDSLGRFYSYYTKDELTRLLENAGFVVENCKEGKAQGLAGNKEPYVVIEATLKT